MNKCKIQDCRKPVKRGFICHMHRNRFARHGDYDISPNWDGLKAGQTFLSPLGYLRINIEGKRVLHHRYIMEQHIGRKLKKEEKVHHINHIKTDNRIENLELLKNHSEHIRKHHLDNWRNRQLYPPVPDNIKKEIISIGNNHKRTRNNVRKECGVSVCGESFRSKGLCSKHMVWYFKNR